MISFLDNYDKLKDKGTILSNDVIKIGESSYLTYNPYRHITELSYFPKWLQEKEEQKYREFLNRRSQALERELEKCMYGYNE